MKEKLCFLCLRHGHQASACKGRSCFKCSRKHHPALCSYKAIRSQPDPKEAVIIKSHVAADLAPPSEPKVQTSATTATFATSQQVARPEQALLWCLEVNVVNSTKSFTLPCSPCWIVEASALIWKKVLRDSWVCAELTRRFKLQPLQLQNRSLFLRTGLR